MGCQECCSPSLGLSEHLPWGNQSWAESLTCKRVCREAELGTRTCGLERNRGSGHRSVGPDAREKVPPTDGTRGDLWHGVCSQLSCLRQRSPTLLSAEGQSCLPSPIRGSGAGQVLFPATAFGADWHRAPYPMPPHAEGTEGSSRQSPWLRAARSSVFQPRDIESVCLFTHAAPNLRAAVAF